MPWNIWKRAVSTDEDNLLPAPLPALASGIMCGHGQKKSFDLYLTSRCRQNSTARTHEGPLPLPGHDRVMGQGEASRSQALRARQLWQRVVRLDELLP